MTSRLDPIATYRLQLTPDFGFAEVVGLLDHVASLGASHLYLSPITEAVPGSTHGYDVVDHRHVRNEFGGMAGLIDLLDAAEGRGLGVLIDHVPNHVSVERAELNPHWWQMLRDGPTSPAARWFDVDWAAGDGKVIIARLGDPLPDVVARAEIETGEGDMGPELRYGPLRFPLAPGTEQLDADDALARQHYRLQWWREPSRNVRRFFTIDDLVAVCVEHDDVAAIVDTIPQQLADHPAFAGVRVDHVDGLADPQTYLGRLGERLGESCWILVEKILADGEHLPEAWPVAGTTGYEHIRTTEHALLEPEAEAGLIALWRGVTGDGRTYDDHEHAARREVLRDGLRPDLLRLGRAVAAASGLAGPDALESIEELTLALPRYRTYLPGDPASAEVLDTAERAARRGRAELADQISRVADLVRTEPVVRIRWQQLTGPVMAKGAEDRAFYRYHPLAALCEVGGTPGRFAIGPERFHLHQRSSQQHTPAGLLAGTTHDTKRSEHVRARALALAEHADEWSVLVDGWFARHRAALGERGLDARGALLALETTVTATPLTAERLGDYLVKAMREAELHTAWVDPDLPYEQALGALAGDVIADVETDGSDLARFAAMTERHGWRYAGAERAIRMTAPGVPDLYQGSLTPMLSLVDPDNRRPPDWDEQRARLAAAAADDTASIWRSDPGLGLVSLTVDLLALRRRRPAAFGGDAGYEPLAVEGPMADRTLVYARTANGAPDVVVAVHPGDPRRPGVDATSFALPPGVWSPVLGPPGEPMEGRVQLASRLRLLPVLVLERSAG